MIDSPSPFSIQALPQPQRSQSLAHSLKHPVCNPLKPNNLRTLCRTLGGIPLSSQFGTRPTRLGLLEASTDLLLLPLCPPAATRFLRIQLELREPPASRASGIWQFGFLRLMAKNYY